MRRPDNGERFLVVDFLRESYESMEELQRAIRGKLRQYLDSHNI